MASSDIEGSSDILVHVKTVLENPRSLNIREALEMRRTMKHWKDLTNIRRQNSHCETRAMVIDSLNYITNWCFFWRFRIAIQHCMV